MALIACSSKPDVGILKNELRPCPDKPNCVSSYASESDKEHFIEALMTSEAEICLEKLGADLTKDAAVELVKSDKDYAHLVYTSSLFRFKDDLELYVDKNRKGLQVRSASRTGYSDIGVNRQRVEDIRLVSRSLCR